MPHTPGLESLLSDPGTGHGSVLSKNNGASPIPLNPLAGGKGNSANTISSTLHSNGDPKQSYSLNGSAQAVTNIGYQEYDDGVPNQLPNPSLLDINNMAGGNFLPVSNLTSANGGVPPMNNTFQNGTYRNSVPLSALGNF
tara:strand:+ start:1487 stop:1906 length:420 start_codon:yes stop_codon:yes gene_type:complete